VAGREDEGEVIISTRNSPPRPWRSIVPPYVARIEALESALVHVAFETKHELGRVPIDGLSLGNIYHVTVTMPDGSKVECKTMLAETLEGRHQAGEEECVK
jgi:hypothetical protein